RKRRAGPPAGRSLDSAFPFRPALRGTMASNRTNPFLKDAAQLPLAAPAPGQFPQVRLRRNRTDDWVRRLVAESRLAAADLIWPVFVQEGPQTREAIPSMPGVERLSIPALIDAAGEAASLGIPALAIFPVVPPEKKSDDGAEACRADNLANRAIRALKEAVPQSGIVCDVALDPYTSHGHGGLPQVGRILNDQPL